MRKTTCAWAIRRRPSAATSKRREPSALAAPSKVANTLPKRVKTNFHRTDPNLKPVRASTGRLNATPSITPSTTSAVVRTRQRG
eukprot:scaffold10141_cov63-Phaeocystis_antarctica.AAC.6